MTGDGNAMSGSNDERLHAYHDGELSALARWRFERELQRSPAPAARARIAAVDAQRAPGLRLEAATPDVWESLHPG
jgi:anti-sigma factor RsiW